MNDKATTRNTWLPRGFVALYMSIAASIGALTVLFVMIRRTAVSRVASVFYLVPLPAALAPLFCGEPIDLLVIAGMATILLGVCLANSRTDKSRAVSAGSPARRPWKLALLDEGSVSEIPWKEYATQGRVGVSIHTLYECGAPPRRMALMRLAPGSSAPTHRHTGYETVFVISGSLRDSHGEHRRGELIVYPPNSEHSYESPEGAVLIVVLDAPTEQVRRSDAA